MAALYVLLSYTSLCWSTGKNGGVRVIYYYHNPALPVFLLTVFAKNERDNLSQCDRNIVKQVVMEIVNTYAARHTYERSR